MSSAETPATGAGAARPPVPRDNPPPWWFENARRVLFLVFAFAAALCGALRAFGVRSLDLEVLYFFAGAGLLLVLERVVEFSVTKDGVSAKLDRLSEKVSRVEDASNELSKTVSAELPKVSSEAASAAAAATSARERLDQEIPGIREQVSSVQNNVEQVEKTAARTQQMVATGVGLRDQPAAAPEGGPVAFSAPSPRADKRSQRRKARWNLPDPTNEEDPQKGRFDGEPVRNGRELRAAVSESDFIPGLYFVTLRVRALTNAPPLTGTVTFFLHDTFIRPVQTVAVSADGVATLEVSAYGAFTVGALADDGGTKLELDLAEVKEFPKAFREL